MPQAPLPAPILVEHESHLHDLAAALRRQPHVAVDTESNSLHAYQEMVCLIQISIPGEDYLIDPLAIPDLEPLGAVFSDPQSEKIFHAAEYDLGTLRRDFGFRITNLFDTRVAARTLGRTKTGLGHLLHEEFNVRLTKRFQRANWGRRPLSPDLLSYARLDSHYLLPLRHRLANTLQQTDRWEEAQEMCEYLARTSTHSTEFDPQGFWRMPHARRLKPIQQSALRELYLFREEEARKADRPPFMIVDDKTLLGIAQAQPENLKALGRLEGMTTARLRRFGRQLLAAVTRGQDSPRPKPPRSPRPDDAVLTRFQNLRHWRKRVANNRKIESDLVIPRDVLWQIAAEAPRDLRTLRQIMGVLHWRFQTYGKEILHLIQS